MASNRVISMWNATTFAKQLHSSLLLLLGVPNIILDKVTLRFLIVCCHCRDTHFQILLICFFFSVRAAHHAETQEEISTGQNSSCMQETQGTPQKCMEESTGSLF
jgi:hypothetical protein